MAVRKTARTSTGVKSALPLGDQLLLEEAALGVEQYDAEVFLFPLW